MTRSSLLKLSITFLTVLALALPLEAQITFGGGATRRRPDEAPKPKRIHGIVQDARGKPLAGARVFIRNTKNNITRTASTVEDGTYTIAGLPPDADYEVSAEFKGQSSEKKIVSSLLNREDNLINFQLNVAMIDA